MAEETKKYPCPNCGQLSTREGNKITCTACDATYTIKKTGAATIKAVGRFEALEQRVDALEGKGRDEQLQDEQQQDDQQQDEQQQDEQQQDDQNEDEGEIFPR